MAVRCKRDLSEHAWRQVQRTAFSVEFRLPRSLKLITTSKQASERASEQASNQPTTEGKIVLPKLR
eukprot:11058025-Alexandrium_andersonii.AAC.1